MSPTTRKRKTAGKAAKTRRPAARRKPAAKKAAKKAAAKVAKKAGARKTAKKAATRRPASKAAPKKSAASAATRSKSAAKPSRAKQAPAKPAPAKSAGRAPAAAARPAAAPKAPAKRPPTAPKKTGSPRQAAADVARQHFREILEAKQQRVKQGPAYPAANAFTGRAHDGVGAVVQPSGEPADANSAGSSPGVEATYGQGEFTHGRGNQGMRGQK